MTAPQLTCYRWSRAYGLRIVGALAIVLAALWVVAALSGFAAWAVWSYRVVGLVALVCALRFVALPPRLLELSSQGYRLRGVRGGGVRTATWVDVESVAGDTGVAGALLVVRLTDGRSTFVPLAMLGSQAVVAEREVHSYLNAAHGYRRLPDS